MTRPLKNGQKLLVEPPLEDIISVVRVLVDFYGKDNKIVVASATEGFELSKVTALVPGDSGVKITLIDCFCSWCRFVAYTFLFFIDWQSHPEIDNRVYFV
jgi:hypothetical protein